MNRRDGGNDGKCGWKPYIGWSGYAFGIRNKYPF